MTIHDNRDNVETTVDRQTKSNSHKLAVLGCSSEMEAKMNQVEWEDMRETQIKRVVIDFIRKRISNEDLKSIRNQTYEDYREELGHGYESEAATTIS